MRPRRARATLPPRHRPAPRSARISCAATAPHVGLRASPRRTRGSRLRREPGLARSGATRSRAPAASITGAHVEEERALDPRDVGLALVREPNPGCAAGRPAPGRLRRCRVRQAAAQPAVAQQRDLDRGVRRQRRAQQRVAAHTCGGRIPRHRHRGGRRADAFLRELRHVVHAAVGGERRASGQQQCVRGCGRIASRRSLDYLRAAHSGIRPWAARRAHWTTFVLRTPVFALRGGPAGSWLRRRGPRGRHRASEALPQAAIPRRRGAAAHVAHVATERAGSLVRVKPFQRRRFPPRAIAGKRRAVRDQAPRRARRRRVPWPCADAADAAASTGNNRMRMSMTPLRACDGACRAWSRATRVRPCRREAPSGRDGPTRSARPGVRGQTVRGGRSRPSAMLCRTGTEHRRVAGIRGEKHDEVGRLRRDGRRSGSRRHRGCTCRKPDRRPTRRRVRGATASARLTERGHPRGQNRVRGRPRARARVTAAAAVAGATSAARHSRDAATAPWSGSAHSNNEQQKATQCEHRARA